MKKIIASSIAMALLPAVLFFGCNKPAPSTPSGPSGPTSTPTVTRTSTFTRTPTYTPTFTPTGTITPYVSPTPQAPQAMVNLGSAANYVILAYSGITNLTPPSTICGGLGLHPSASVDGGIVEICGGPNDIANTAADVAKTNLSTAYTDASSRPGAAAILTEIGGQTIYPGLYNSGGDLTISSGDLTLDALGDMNAVFIFQVTGILNVTSGRQVHLLGNADPARIFWVVSDFCSLGTTVSFKGNILAYNSVTMNTGAVLEGRALGSNGNVTLLANTITRP